MRWLMNRLRRDGSERGAVAVIVAVLIGGGVLLGMGAMVVDAGQMYAERAQLQNGADSAALAVAISCAKGSCNADLANGEANGNANDDTSKVDLVCGTGMASCPVPRPNALDCATTPQGNYAEVHTSTLTPGGSTFLPPVFGRALLGSSYQGADVGACARASWGPPSQATGLALTISWCEWNADTNGGTDYPAPPPATPPASAEIVLYFHNTNPAPTHCTAGPSGFDVPGDFGTTTSDSNCQTLFNFDPANGTTTYGADPGSNLPGDCQTALQNAQQNKTVVFIPIYVQVGGTGNNGTYTLWQMGAFVVTGYFWPNWKAKSWLTVGFPCSGNQRCISGYFTTGVDPGTGSIGTGQGAGASTVQLTG